MSLIRTFMSARIRRCVLFLLVLQSPLIVCAQAFTFEPVKPVVVSARLAGLGGAYSALEAGFDTLSTNPAALAYVSEKWSIARLAAEVSGPLFDLPVVMQSDDITTGILDLVGENNGVDIGMNVTGPISFGKVDRNFGFGIFNRTVTTADIPSITRATVLMGEELLFVGGYGLSVFEREQHSIAVGLQMKGFFQTFLYESGTSLAVLNTFMDFNTDVLPTVLSTGFGVDIGVMYRFGGNFSAAVTCKDLYTPVFTTDYDNMDAFMNGTENGTLYDRLAPDLSLGVLYKIPVPSQWSTITGWSVMMDYRDALDIFNTIARNPVLNIACGTELVLLDVVSLRAGIRETYLSAGLGLDLTLFQLDFAMYGTELGIEPGERPLLNMAFSLAFQY
jgi:hypothetical protein